MKDLFARVGTVLGHLLAASTVHGPAREESLRIIDELKASSDSIEDIVRERVRQELEGIHGKVVALEHDQLRTREAVFNGAPPAAFDHDRDGNPGGSPPAPPTDNPDEMTVAQAKAWLDERSIEYPAAAKKAELVELVKAAQVTPQEPAETGDATISSGVADDSLTGGAGDDTLGAGDA